MRASGINQNYSNYGLYYQNRPRVNTRAQQQDAKTKSAVKTVAVVGGAALAIIFRKQLGSLLKPLKNAVKNKFPDFSNAASAVKGRAGRIFSPVKKGSSEWIKNTGIPGVKHAAQDTVTFAKDKAIPAVKKAGENTADFAKNKVKPKISKVLKKFFNKVAQVANNDLTKVSP